MARNDLPHPATATFADATAARDYVMSRPGAVVVKADGLSAGKGAIVTSSIDEAFDAIDDILVRGSLGRAGSRVVIEDRISGREVSVHAFSDGRAFRSMPLSCDHKAVFDGNIGPNTGGMGVFSPPGWLDAGLGLWIEAGVTGRTIAGMAAEGRPFRGVLYPQVMVTESGPQMIEFNARFGDPETQALLVRLESDLLEIALACVKGNLDAVDVRWTEGASVCVVLASGGYPGAYATGLPIHGLDSLDDGVYAFHAGTKREAVAVLTNGGRVLGITATGPDLESARALAYANVERIHFDGMHYRRDIGAN
jgi:phosphoribosylamine--glycine ligase